MAINVSYNGATIWKPGAYSKVSIDLGGAFPLGQTGIVGIIGESTTGKPGKDELDIGLNAFTPDQMITLREKYGQGSIVDAAAMLFAPASDGAIPSGAQAIYIWKTNASIRAWLDLASNYGKVQAEEYGIGGNRIAYTASAISEVAPTVTGSVIAFSPVAEVTQITCPAVAGLTQADYFMFYDQAGTDWAIWFDIDAAGVAPTGALYTGSTNQIMVSVVTGDTALDVADKLYAAVNGVITTASFVDPASTSATVVATQTVAGVCTDALPKNADDSGAGSIVINITVQGDNADGSVLANVEFDLYINGVKTSLNVFTSGVESDYDTAAKAAALIDAALAATSVSCTEDAGKLVFTYDVDATAYTKGYGKTIELADADAGVSLGKLGLTAGLTTSTVESAVTITLNQKRDLIVESDTVGGNVVLEVGCQKTGLTSASIVINATSVILKENAVAVATFSKSAYNALSTLIEDMNLTTDWNVKISSALYNSLSPSVLDYVNLGALSEAGLYAAKVKKDAYEISQFFSESQLTSLVAVGTTPVAKTGLPAAQTEVLLSGGALGATTGSDITDALNKFEGLRINFIVPLFSRDAIDDVSDSLTDASSTYTIDAIHQAVKTHLSLTATTKFKSERQAVLSYKAPWDDCKLKSATLSDYRIQLVVQDTRNVDSIGNIKWFQPWSLACYVAGSRSGSPVGTPLTFKYMNCSGSRHTAQPMSTDEQNIVVDFDPRTQYEDAIRNGITFLENPQSGGFRIVVDNTTYNKDANWVRNRGNVQYAADILAYDFRNQVENIYVGVKNTITAGEVRSVCQSIIATYLAQGITVSADDAPNGYKDLSVIIDGNVIRISFTAKLVEGIDFVLTDITISRVVTAA